MGSSVLVTYECDQCNRKKEVASAVASPHGWYAFRGVVGLVSDGQGGAMSRYEHWLCSADCGIAWFQEKKADPYGLAKDK